MCAMELVHEDITDEQRKHVSGFIIRWDAVEVYDRAVNSRKTGWRREFPDFVLDVEIPETFQDSSWHNDACPCFISTEHRLCLWVNYSNPKDREYPGIKQFMLTVVNAEGCHTNEDTVHVESDDFADITSFISTHAAKA